MLQGPWYDPLLAAARESLGQIASDKIDNLLSEGADVHASDWDHNTVLHYLAAGNNVSGIRTVVSHGAVVDLLNTETKTALYMAMENKAFDAVMCLIDLHASVKPKCTHMQLTALHLAAKHGETDLARIFLERGARVDSLSKEKITPLMHACENGHWPVAELLLSHGADVLRKDCYGRVALHFSCMSGNVECVRNVVEYDPSALEAVTRASRMSPYSAWNAAMFAALSGSVEVSRYLRQFLPNALQVQEERCNCLFTAAEHGHHSLVKWILAQDAYPPSLLDSAGILCGAILGKNKDVCETLIQHGASVNAKANDGYTPVHFAVICDDPDMLDFLLSRGAHAEIPAHDGWTPLFIAVTHNNLTCVQLLLQYGADPYRKCVDNTSAFDMARTSSEYAIVLEYMQAFLQKPEK